MKPSTIPLFNKWKIRGGIYVSDDKFLREIVEPARYVDIITFTCNAELANALPIRRLIAARVNGEFKKGTQVRLTDNVHTKLYLVYQRGNPRQSAWVGSANLVEPSSWHNLMVEVNSAQLRSLQIYFDKMWSLCDLHRKEHQ